MNKIHGLSAFALLCAVSVSASTPRTFISPRTNENKTDPPFSGAVKVGDTLYISGQIGLGPDRKPPADVTAEAKLVMDAVKKQLTDAGMTPDDLVSCKGQAGTPWRTRLPGRAGAANG